MFEPEQAAIKTPESYRPHDGLCQILTHFSDEVICAVRSVRRDFSDGACPPVRYSARRLCRVDTPDMLIPEFDLMQRYPACFATLQAYWNAHQDSKAAAAEFDGWIGRLTSVPEIPPESLSGIHGKLIAFGYLKFELSPKDASLRYQLTPLGRSAVTGESPFESAADMELAQSA